MVVSRVLAAAVVAAGLGVAAPASAAPGGCRVNVLCLYGTSGRVSQYSELTDYFQQLSRSDVTYAWNRTPGAVYFNYSTGVTSCMLGNREASVQHAGYGTVTGVRLVAANRCY
ncbi:hypothetical protein [Actinoplanes sp. RD1]|uniref:hypothetical protein n=1 Tax=Actinoplanes sp. RD1 TaxID=3064538 RepID=UPI002741F6C1|nr:hypothetical protein [Actinoplanes sp. RD1]